MFPGSEFPETLKSNNFGQPAQQDSAWLPKILLHGKRTRGEYVFDSLFSALVSPKKEGIP
jgi:hypothetical protein